MVEQGQMTELQHKQNQAESCHCKVRFYSHYSVAKILYFCRYCLRVDCLTTLFNIWFNSKYCTQQQGYDKY